MQDAPVTPEEEALWLAADLELARREARRGDVKEYLFLQWPDYVFDDWQIEHIIKPGMSGEISEIFIKGCTKPGKGFAVAVLANIWYDVFEDARVIITSSSIEHAERVMYGEIAAVRKAMKHPQPGTKVLQAEFQHNSKHYVACANPKTGEGFSGQHGGKTLFIFDEASSSPESLFENSQKQAALIVALSNPRTLSGWFRRAFDPAQDIDATQQVLTSTGRRQLVTIGGMDCRNVKEKRLEKPLGPIGGIDIQGRHFAQGETIPKEFFVDVKLAIPNQLDYGRYMANKANPDKRKVAVFADGKFPDEDEDLQLFMRSWYPRHEEAWAKIEKNKGNVEVTAFGLDVGGTEFGDPSVLAAGSEQGLRKLCTVNQKDTMKVARWAIDQSREMGVDLTLGMHPIAVDTDGLGKGVADKLAELGCSVIRINNGRAPDVSPELYANKRAECYAELARRMNPAEYAEPWAIPFDYELRDELAAPEKIYLADQIKFRITPKDRFSGMVFTGDTIKEKLDGRSPDKADATVYMYAAVRSLEMSLTPTCNRPLILVTEEEEKALVAAEGPVEIRQKTTDEMLREILQADDVAAGEVMVEYPDWV